MEENYWHSRGYLPHYDEPGLVQSVTIRLHDSLPAGRLEQWREELSVLDPQQAEFELWHRIERYLDSGAGECWLRRHDIASLVQDQLLWYERKDYDLHAWVIMPNHLHVLLTISARTSLSDVVRNWKSFTAKRSNSILQRSGPFWQREYFDRFIRSDRHFEDAFAYIENNPVKAKLCSEPEDWLFGSAYVRKRMPGRVS
jgi:REP element-mobilizing transposase RayT